MSLSLTHLLRRSVLSIGLLFPPAIWAQSSAVMNAGTLTLGSAGSGLVSTVSGGNFSAGVTMIGAGSLNLNGSNTYTGTLTVPPGSTVQLNSGALSLNGLVLNGGTLQVNNGTLTGSLSNGLTVQNAALILTPSAFTGATLTMNSGTTLNGTGRLSLAKTGGGTLDLGVNLLNGSLTTFSGQPITSTGALTINTAGSANSVILNGNVLLLDYGELTRPGRAGSGSTTMVTNAQASVLGSYLVPSGETRTLLFRVEYGRDTNYGSVTKIDPEAAVDVPFMAPATRKNFAALLDWLQPSTTYHYRTKVIALGANGAPDTVVYGPDRTFTTSAMIEGGPFWMEAGTRTLTPQDLRSGFLLTAAAIPTTDGQPLRPVFLAATPGLAGTTQLSSTQVRYRANGQPVEDSFRVKIGFANALPPAAGLPIPAATAAYLVNVKIKTVMPPTIDTLNATISSNITVHFSARFVANSGSATAAFEYGLTPACESTIALPLLTSGSGLIINDAFRTASVTDLKPNTLYYYRARTTNPAGEAVTPVATFSTPAVVDGGRISCNGIPTTFAITDLTLPPPTIGTDGFQVHAGGTLNLSASPLGTVNLGPGLFSPRAARVSSGVLNSSLSKTGVGTLVLTGSVNTYTGGTLVTGGSVTTTVTSSPISGFTGPKEVRRTFPGTYGTTTTDGTTITYTPGPNFPGTDSFEVDLQPRSFGAYGILGGNTSVFGVNSYSSPFSPTPFRVRVTVRPSRDAVDKLTPASPVTGLTSADLGAFAGTIVTDAGKVRRLFLAGGTTGFSLGDAAPGLPGSKITRIGEPSGRAVLVTLAPKAGTITAANDIALINDLDGTPSLAAMEGGSFSNAPDLRIRSFGAIDGNGSVTFFLVTLQGPGVNATNDLSLAAAPVGGPAKILVREGQLVNGQRSTHLATLVASAGSLAEGRWRTGDNSFGVRLTFADRSQAIFNIPLAAQSPADWTPLAPWGVGGLRSPFVGVDFPWEAAVFTAYGLPGFGKSTAAVRTSFRVGGGGITSENNVAVFFNDRPIVVKGDPIDPANAADSPVFADFADPVGGAPDRFAFAATLGGRGVTAANRASLWYVTDANTATPELVQLARAGSPAPGGGRFASFTSLALPDGTASGPIFTAKLAPGDGVTAATNTGLWAANAAGEVALILRTGQSIGIAGTGFSPEPVASFVALAPAAGSLGAARGYDDAGHVSVLVTFRDRTTALVKLTIP